ncbi:Regulator of microtubule dynamics protein 1, partial [Galemys pyrenaicus]
MNPKLYFLSKVLASPGPRQATDLLRGAAPGHSARPGRIGDFSAKADLAQRSGAPGPRFSPPELATSAKDRWISGVEPGTCESWRLRRESRVCCIWDFVQFGGLGSGRVLLADAGDAVLGYSVALRYFPPTWLLLLSYGLPSNPGLAAPLHPRECGELREELGVSVPGALLVMGNPSAFKRSLLFSAMSYFGFGTYQVVSQTAVVHATAKVLKVEEILEQADYLYESGETEKLYQLLTQYKESEDAELLWRLARASRDVAQLCGTSEEQKKLLVYEALEYAKRALEKNESNFAAHKRAIKLNPKDATSIHLMGIWCYTFAEMPWYQRRIAKVLFATPPSSTYEEALGYFQKAEQVDPNFYSKNLLLLGKTYMKLRNKKLAAFWLLKAKDYPAHTEEDKQ